MSCVGVALAIYAALAIIGAPVWLLVRPASPPISDALAAPIVGFAVLEVFSWYWLRYADLGMHAGVAVVGSVALVALAAGARSRRSSVRVPAFGRSVSTAALLVAVGAVFVVEFRVPLRVGHLTSGSIWNADAALYANVASNLVSHGFHWAGNIVGLNLGAKATDAAGIGPGVYSALAAAAAGTGTGVWQAALPLLLVGVALGALAVRDAARLLLPGGLVVAPAIALLATTASLFGYVTTNFFLAEILTMPLVLAELLVLHWIARQPSWRERAGGLVLLVAIVTTAALSYSPMAFVMQPIVLAAICLGEVGRGWLRRSAVVVVSTAGAFVVAYALVPAPFTRSAEFVRHSFTGAKGWPLGLMTPFDVLGFQQAVRTPRHVVGLFMVESLLVGGVALAAVWVLWNQRRRAAIFSAAAMFVVLGSYTAAYIDRGYSYEQWKWISFFQPVVIATAFALVASAAGVLIAKWKLAPRISGRALAAVAVVVLVAASSRALVIETRHTRAFWVAGEPVLPWSIVSSPLSQLAARPALDHLPAVNVDLPQWDAMWAAYFLQPTTRVYLVSPTYFPVSAPGARSTLVAVPPVPNGLVPVRYVVVKGVPAGITNGS